MTQYAGFTYFIDQCTHSALFIIFDSIIATVAEVDVIACRVVRRGNL